MKKVSTPTSKSQRTQSLEETTELPQPELWINCWLEPNVETNSMDEMGIRLSWRLPDNVDAIEFDVDGEKWGPFSAKMRSLNIPYPSEIRTIEEQAVRVKAKYVKYGAETVLSVMDPFGDINVILSDIVVMGYQDPTNCPDSQYNNSLTPVWDTNTNDGAVWKVTHSSKDSNGFYKPVYLIIEPPSTSAAETVSLVIIPGTDNNQNGNPEDKHLYSEKCSALAGTFTVENGTTAKANNGSIDVRVKGYRENALDYFEAHILVPQNYTITARLRD